MLIGNTTSQNEHVEFVDYTGRWPNLCGGILTLKIDGKVVRFGNKAFGATDTTELLPKFWISGGCCGFTDSSYRESYRKTGEWQINVSELPEAYRKYATEIDRTMNEHVEYGCCGGCL